MSAECLFCLPNEPLVLDQLVTFYRDIQPYLFTDYCQLKTPFCMLIFNQCLNLVVKHDIPEVTFY